MSITNTTFQEYYDIFQQIYDNSYKLFDKSEYKDSAIYAFSDAIYDVWVSGTDFEQKLANKLVQKWVSYLSADSDYDYRNTKHNPDRLEYDEYKTKWFKNKLNTYADHKGITAALHVFEITYNKT